MRRLLSAIVSAIVLAAFAAGCAGGTSPSSDADEIEITMRDTVFDPSSVEVEKGEEVTFRFVNRGSLEHDAFIGDDEAQDEHEQAMRDAEVDKHDAHGAGDEGVTVAPGKSATLTHTFDERGEVLIGCHQPGHYAGGMVVKVTVT